MKLTIKSMPCSLTEFYDTVATEMGYTDTSNLNYDCREVNIASNIQDDFYNYYIGITRETDSTVSEHDARVGTTMLLAMCGPKVDENLKANEVEVFEGFICQREV